MSATQNPDSPGSQKKDFYISVGGFRLARERKLRLSYQAVVVALFFIFVVLLLKRGDAFLHHILEDFAQKLSDRSGWGIYEVKGALLILTIPFFLLVAIQSPWDLFYDSESLQASTTGKKALWLLGVSALYGGLSLILFDYASREAYAYKFCADIPEDVLVSDVSGGKDHLYGHSFHPCTLEEVRFLRNKQDHSLAATEVQIPDWRHIHWKDPGSGTVNLYYSRRPDGYHFFNHSGTDPEGGAELAPVNQAVVTQYQQAQLQQANAAQDILLVTQAQTSLEANDFAAAIKACDTVSTHNDGEPCVQITHDASVQWAHKVVDQGQAQLQRAEYDAAVRSAQHAIQLDPENAPARDLLQMASTLKSQASTD